MKEKLDPYLQPLYDALNDMIPPAKLQKYIEEGTVRHTAMLPMLAKTQYRGGMQAGLKFLLTIHNIAFQGKFGFDYVHRKFMCGYHLILILHQPR